MTRPPPLIWNRMGVLTSEKPPSGSERSFHRPDGLGQPFQHILPFAAHFSFCSVSLWGRHLSAPRAVILKSCIPVLLPSARPRSWVPGIGPQTRKFRAGGPHSRRGPNSPRCRKCGSLGRISLQGCWGEVRGDRCSLAHADRPFPILGQRTRQWEIHGLQGRTDRLDRPRLRVHAPKSGLGSGYWAHFGGAGCRIPTFRWCPSRSRRRAALMRGQGRMCVLPPPHPWDLPRASTWS